MSNIPIYRAKEKNSDRQVIGYLKDEDTIMEIIGICIRPVNIDATTVAIHFPDMLASDSDRYLPNGEKDLRIFASLQEDGKGGDILYWHNMTDEPDCKPSTVIFKNNRIECFGDYFDDLDIDAMITIGIQE